MSLPNSDSPVDNPSTDLPTANPLAAESDRVASIRQTYDRLAQESLADLEQRRQTLQVSIAQLERKQERIRQEINQSFAGSSQEIAIRIQGFKDYLVGSLQDLVAIAEETELPEPKQVDRYPVQDAPLLEIPIAPVAAPSTQFREPPYQSNARRIRELLELYQTDPDYYGPPWQLRRALEKIHVDRTLEWFLDQGGRGALKAGGRNQNATIGAAAISILREIYGDRVRVLISANAPERLGEWRRGLQDCLGLVRSDFSPNGGIILFEEPEPLAIKAERIVAEGDLPFIILDDSDGLVSLALLQYPLWLAFAPELPQSNNNDYRY
jgi:hypothetical protein